MKKFVLILLVVIVGFIVFSQIKHNQKYGYIDSKIELEKKYPKRNVSTEFYSRKRIFHNGYDIDIKINNKSEYTTYKNFKFKITSIGNSGTVIRSEYFTLYEKVSFLEKKVFNYKTKNIDKKYKYKIELVDLKLDK